MRRVKEYFISFHQKHYRNSLQRGQLANIIICVPHDAGVLCVIKDH